MIGWLRRLLREPVTIAPVTLTIAHTHNVHVEHDVSNVMRLYANQVIDQLGKHSVVHEIGTATMEDLQSAIAAGIRTYLDESATAAANLPRARLLATPPEPEERIARDIKRAKAISRGANSLMAKAAAMNITLSPEDALAQAASMLHSTLED